jgi:hypothetical protein
MRGFEFTEMKIPENFVFHANKILNVIVNKSIINKSH